VGCAFSYGTIVSWHHGCVRCLLRESTHVGLICMADQWAWCPLAAKVAPVASGGELFSILGTPRMILGTIHKDRHFASLVV
jgi:hypothetical protein